ELFLDGDVGHGCAWRGSMPMFFAWREPDEITGPDRLNGSAFALGPAATSRHEQSLAERMGVPCGARARFECYARTLNHCRIGGLKWRVNPHGAGEPLGWSLSGRLSANSFDFHFSDFLWLLPNGSSLPKTPITVSQ